MRAKAWKSNMAATMWMLILLLAICISADKATRCLDSDLNWEGILITNEQGTVVYNPHAGTCTPLDRNDRSRRNISTEQAVRLPSDGLVYYVNEHGPVDVFNPCTNKTVPVHGGNFTKGPRTDLALTTWGNSLLVCGGIKNRPNAQVVGGRW